MGLAARRVFGTCSRLELEMLGCRWRAMINAVLVAVRVLATSLRQYLHWPTSLYATSLFSQIMGVYVQRPFGHWNTEIWLNSFDW